VESRAYFFGNMYLSSIQQGIQALHCTAEMFIKYADQNEPNYYSLREWASISKTTVLLNAGYGDEIRDLIVLFSDPDCDYPWAEFYEEKASLDGALTCVGIILPGFIYEGARLVREGLLSQEELKYGAKVPIDKDGILSEVDINKWDYEFILRLNNYGLAK